MQEILHALNHYVPTELLTQLIPIAASTEDQEFFVALMELTIYTAAKTEPTILHVSYHHKLVVPTARKILPTLTAASMVDLANSAAPMALTIFTASWQKSTELI
jgi:hypothetical protein